MIIGRCNELSQLRGLLNSYKSEFYAVYGRRRVGKTFLIREAFKYNFTFQHTGILDATKSEQISEFVESLHRSGLGKCKMPKSWLQAFHLLERFIETLPECKKKKVLFIDELPWMDTNKSNFLKALDHFWNGWATTRNDIILIVCGSATSWIIDKVINDYGGLHNRLTGQIYLRPFRLSECEEFCNTMKLGYRRKQIVEAYMVLGGIPYYWSYLRKGLSIAQNIDRMFFSHHGELTGEFDALYASLFKNPEPHLKIITALAKKRIGLTRAVILESTRMSDNKTFVKALKELIQCDFLRNYTSFGKKSKGSLYQLVDNYTLFYFKFILQNLEGDTNFWSANYNTSVHNSWAGLAYEMVCLQHLEQIKTALGISGIICHAHSWIYKSENDKGAQIDLLIDRADDVINLCEIKYSKDKYTIDEEEDEKLRHRESVFVQETQTTKTIHMTMITAHGLADGGHTFDIHSQVTMNDLFD